MVWKLLKTCENGGRRFEVAVSSSMCWCGILLFYLLGQGSGRGPIGCTMCRPDHIGEKQRSVNHLWFQRSLTH